MSALASLTASTTLSRLLPACFAIAVAACGGNVASEPQVVADSGSQPAPSPGYSMRDAGTTTTVDAAPKPSVAPEAGTATVPCTLPPIDVTACNVDADCAKVLRGCYCNARPVTGVNVAYVKPAQACEDQQQANCLIDCVTQPGFVSQADPTVVPDLDDIEVYCNQVPEVGMCRTRRR